MTNREKIADKLQPYGLTVGCYDAGINNLNKTNLAKLIEGIEYGGDTDVIVNINRKKHVVEIVTTAGENEVDFYLLTKREYDERYN